MKLEAEKLLKAELVDETIKKLGEYAFFAEKEVAFIVQLSSLNLSLEPFLASDYFSVLTPKEMYEIYLHYCGQKYERWINPTDIILSLVKEGIAFDKIAKIIKLDVSFIENVVAAEKLIPIKRHISPFPCFFFIKNNPVEERFKEAALTIPREKELIYYKVEEEVMLNKVIKYYQTLTYYTYKLPSNKQVAIQKQLAYDDLLISNTTVTMHRQNELYLLITDLWEKLFEKNVSFEETSKLVEDVLRLWIRA